MTQANAIQDRTTSIPLEATTYEVLRNRLEQHATILRNRLVQLDTARQEVFGTIETRLLTTDRINTHHSCTARDIVAIGQQCLFAYNVHIGLRSEITLSDVFSSYEYQDGHFHEADLNLLEDERFIVDFQNLYRYYKEASFARFVQQDAYLYLVFQVSKNVGDVKAFKWLIKDDQLHYIDGRSEHELRLAKQYEFRWKRAGRDTQRSGRHPHVSILDRVFVETVGGDLTIKVEDNTDDGLGIYREPVAFPDQTLDDADFHFADLGHLIVLKIQPYQEDDRYFVFNEKMQQVHRIEALQDSGVLLPDGQGLIFANGYYLQTGEIKIFDQALPTMRFDRRIVSPNGEDYLFVFSDEATGHKILLRYNLIRQKVETPMLCHGYCILPDGELCYFNSDKVATKHHAVQIWQTTFAHGQPLPTPHQDSLLYKIGNKAIVKAMAACHEVLALTNKHETYQHLYPDIAKACTRILDHHYWLAEPAAFSLDQPLQDMRRTAHAAIEEYEKKRSIQRNTDRTIADLTEKVTAATRQAKHATFDHINEYVTTLATLRSLRGATVSAKDLRYADQDHLVALETEIAEVTTALAAATVDFLLQAEALQPYQEKIQAQEAMIAEVKTAQEANELITQVDQTGTDLQLLIEIVSNLKIEDATQTTEIIERISSFYASLNQVKASIRQHHKALRGTEAHAAFQAQIKLLEQGLTNYLDLADTPAQCDHFLTQLMVRVEELESKFAEFDDFLLHITEQRETIYNAFDIRRKQLIEARNNRTAALLQAAERILKGIGNRLRKFQTTADINGFFAADLMVDKVRDIVKQLLALEDSNKADQIRTRLKTLQEEAIRQLRDQQDLFVAGENKIKFGKHIFNVNVQPLELTIVQQNKELYYHLTGTDFYERIEDPVLLSTKSVWQQSLISENSSVYRAEYLAYAVFKSKIIALNDESLPTASALKAMVQEYAAAHPQEGYTKGIHDEDATLILQALIDLHHNLGSLRYPPDVRAFARIMWEQFVNPAIKDQLQAQISGAAKVLEIFPNTREFDYLLAQLATALEQTAVDTFKK